MLDSNISDMVLKTLLVADAVIVAYIVYILLGRTKKTQRSIEQKIHRMSQIVATMLKERVSKAPSSIDALYMFVVDHYIAKGVTNSYGIIGRRQILQYETKKRGIVQKIFNAYIGSVYGGKNVSENTVTDLYNEFIS